MQDADAMAREIEQAEQHDTAKYNELLRLKETFESDTEHREELRELLG